MARYFDELIPALAHHKEEAFGALRGRIAIIIRSCGNWTIQLGNLQTPVVSGAEPQAELALSFTEEAFRSLLQGDLDIDHAVEGGQIAFDGKLQLLESFGLLMQDAQDLLSIRERD